MLGKSCAKHGSEAADSAVKARRAPRIPVCVFIFGGNLCVVCLPRNKQPTLSLLASSVGGRSARINKHPLHSRRHLLRKLSLRQAFLASVPSPLSSSPLPAPFYSVAVGPGAASPVFPRRLVMPACGEFLIWHRAGVFPPCGSYFLVSEREQLASGVPSPPRPLSPRPGCCALALCVVQGRRCGLGPDAAPQSGLPRRIWVVVILAARGGRRLFTPLILPPRPSHSQVQASRSTPPLLGPRRRRHQASKKRSSPRPHPQPKMEAFHRRGMKAAVALARSSSATTPAAAARMAMPQQRQFFQAAYNLAKKVTPKISSTEAAALEAGTVGFDRDLFAGNPSLAGLKKKYDLKVCL